MTVTRPRAADDFAVIRARMAELCGDPDATGAGAGLGARHTAMDFGGVAIPRLCEAARSAPSAEPGSDAVLLEVRELLDAEPAASVVWATDLRKLFARSTVKKHWAFPDLCTRIELDRALQAAFGDNYLSTAASMTIAAAASVEIVGEGEHWDCLKAAIENCSHVPCSVISLDEVVHRQVARNYEPPDIIVTTSNRIALVNIDAKFRYDRYKKSISPLYNPKPLPRVTDVGLLWENPDWFSVETSAIGQKENPVFDTVQAIDDILAELHGPPHLAVLMT